MAFKSISKPNETGDFLISYGINLSKSKHKTAYF